jgi:hypothetical protein
MAMPDEPWYEEPTDLYLRRKEQFQKKRPMQLAAALGNLVRYQQMLLEQPIARLISANFIHPEGAESFHRVRHFQSLEDDDFACASEPVLVPRATP